MHNSLCPSARLRVAVLVVTVLVLTVVVGLGSNVDAAPTITNVSLRGLTIGAAQVLVVDGTDLLPDPKLILSVPLAAQTVQAGATANRVAFELTVADAAQPGIHALRVAGAKGVSNPVLLAIDRLPQTPVSDQTASLPAALLGSLTSDGRVRTTILGKKGQSLAAEVECQRLGSSFRPVLRVYDARGVQLAWSGPMAAIGGDARLSTTLPADGSYVVEVHDVMFRAPGPGFFRLKLGAFHFADASFPNGVMRGGVASLELRRSSLPLGTRIEFDARSLLGVGEYPATWGASGGAGPLTGTPPRVVVSDLPEVLEPSEPAVGPKPVTAAPLAIHGCLAIRGEEDRYKIPVVPGAKLQFDLQAQRYGAPLDGVLTILGPNGNTLAANDDRPGTPDPGVDVTVPADVLELVAVVRDLEGRGGPEFTYRLVVRDLNRPDLTLTLESDRLNVPAGGTQLLTIPVTRQGDPGPIRLELPGLPAGVEATGLTIPPTNEVGLVALSAAAGAVPSATVTMLVGHAANGEPPVVRAAQSADSGVSRFQPWLRRDLAIAVTEASPLAVTWVPSAPDEKLTLGGKLPLKAQVVRLPGLAGQVRIRLVTGQLMPKKTVKQNNQDVRVDDVDRALRLEAVPTLAPEMGEATTSILVPADLPAGPWNMALVAELLSADGKAVVLSTATPVRTLTAGN